MAPRSILKKKGTPKASSPPEHKDDTMNDSLNKLQRENSLSSEDGRIAFAKARSPLSQNAEQEGSSTRNLTRVLGIKKQMSMRGIQFSDNVEVNDISRLRESAIDLCFYSDESLSNFRYEAFCEDCGRDSSEFD
jgi:hypothetical protein